uniref:Uncharacterized protein n=1 Tax=Klebsiella pneumoniae TaxID=573 RepID=A7KGF2_KLEPN|nr:hypothetical protein [Klebsiella pneumoniae]
MTTVVRSSNHYHCQLKPVGRRGLSDKMTTMEMSLSITTTVIKVQRFNVNQ